MFTCDVILPPPAPPQKKYNKVWLKIISIKKTVVYSVIYSVVNVVFFCKENKSRDENFLIEYFFVRLVVVERCLSI